MLNSSSSRYGRNNSVRRTSSFRNTLTSFLGTNLTQKDNRTQNNNNGTRDTHRNNSGTLRKRASIAFFHSSGTDNQQAGDRHTDSRHADNHHTGSHHEDNHHKDNHHEDNHHKDNPHKDNPHKDNHHADSHHEDDHHTDNRHTDSRHTDSHHTDNHHANGHHTSGRHTDNHHSSNHHHADNQHRDSHRHHTDNHHTDSHRHRDTAKKPPTRSGTSKQHSSLSETRQTSAISTKPKTERGPSGGSASESLSSTSASASGSVVSSSTVSGSTSTTNNNGTSRSSQRPGQKSLSGVTPRSKRNGDISATVGRSSIRNDSGASTRTRNPSETASENGSQMTVSAPPPPPSAKEFLIEYLTQRGLLRPKVIYERPEFKISISSSGDHVFLPTMSCNDDEYLARLNGFRQDDDFEVMDNAESRIGQPFGSTANGGLRTRASTPSFHSSNPFRQSPSMSLTPRPTFEMDRSMAALTVAVIVSIPERTKISYVEAELYSIVRIHWYAGVPPTRSFQEENYGAGKLNWSLGADNMNVFIPLNVSSKEKIIQNNRNIRQMSLFKNLSDSQRIYLEKSRIRKELIGQAVSKKTQVMQPGDYVYIIPIAFNNHIPESLYLPSARVHYRFCVAAKMLDGKTRSLSLQQQKALQEERHQESEANGHRKFGLLKKIKGGHSQSGLSSIKDTIEDPNESFAEYPIYVIRTPPPISISTANKPIYIDRVWTDSLSYEVSFAKKYVALGSKVPVKINLEPLTPDVFVKRVRVSIVEKITFVSKNYEYEYDQVDPVARDPYNPYFNEFAAKRKKERSLSLLEVRTRDKGARAIKEEIVENCVDDNLLSYTADGDIGPLYIETNVDFPCFEDLDKNAAKQIPPYGVDAYANIPNPENPNSQASNHGLRRQSSHINTLSRRNSVIGFLTSRKSSLSPTPRSSSGDLRSRASFSHSSFSFSPQPTSDHPRVSSDQRFHETKLRSTRGVVIKKHTRLNKPRRGLYLDSLHFTNIHSRHKLEVMLRISKPDVLDPTKLRHYEVLIDTPIFLISEKCSEGNMELPTYSDAINDPLSPSKRTNRAAPPSFEEAISVPGSPIESPSGTPALSPLGSSTSTSVASRAANTLRDSDVQQLCLGTTSNLASPENSVRRSTSSGVNPNFSNDNQMFNNLDKLMSSPGTNSSSRNEENSTQEFMNGEGVGDIFDPDDLDMTRPTFNKKSGGLDPESSKKTRSLQPPKYDEVIP